PDLYSPQRFWLGETSKEILEAVGRPLPTVLSLESHTVPVYYGPRLQDVDALPSEESLLTRVLSAHGIAVAWITIDQFGDRTSDEPQGPTDPIFFLRRPASGAAHVWRLFRQKHEAEIYMSEFYGRDSEGRDWAESLPNETFEQLLERHAEYVKD